MSAFRPLTLAAVLLVSGVMVGVSSGGTEAITQPSTIVLTEVEGTGIVPAVLRADGKETGIMLMTEGRLEDADGNRVGTFRIVCTGFEGGHANMCTRVDSIKPGPVPAFPFAASESSNYVDWVDAGKYPHPFATHPNVALYAGSQSPHKVETFGCTICHDGQGSGTSFSNASHTPGSA